MDAGLQALLGNSFPQEVRCCLGIFPSKAEGSPADGDHVLGLEIQHRLQSTIDIGFFIARPMPGRAVGQWKKGHVDFESLTRRLEVVTVGAVPGEVNISHAALQDIRRGGAMTQGDPAKTMVVHGESVDPNILLLVKAFGRDLRDRIGQKFSHEFSDPLGYDNGCGRFKEFIAKQVQMIVMGVTYQDGREFGEVFRVQPRFLNTFKKQNFIGEIGIGKKGLPPGLNQRSGMADKGNLQW